MRSTTFSSASDRIRASLGQRGAAFLLALAIEVLIALLLLFLAPAIAPKAPPKKPVVFGFETDSGDAVQPKETAKKKAASKGSAGATRPPPVPIPEATPPPSPPETPYPLSYIPFTRRDYAASDIATMPSRGADSGDTPGTGRSDAGDSAVAEGLGPHGERLYAAEWHVRPTHAQLNAYIPARARASGWGLIACRTVDNYRVEDCQELGEAPRGSGLAGAVRQAAWQFRVRPPRVGGRALVGAWVSIRIDYSFTRE